MLVKQQLPSQSFLSGYQVFQMGLACIFGCIGVNAVIVIAQDGKSSRLDPAEYWCKTVKLVRSQCYQVAGEGCNVRVQSIDLVNGFGQILLPPDERSGVNIRNMHNPVTLKCFRQVLEGYAYFLDPETVPFNQCSVADC